MYVCNLLTFLMGKYIHTLPGRTISFNTKLCISRWTPQTKFTSLAIAPFAHELNTI